MNNIAKLSIGLVTTGTVATGAIFASSHLRKGKVDSEPSNIDSKALAISWEKRRRNRLSELKKIFSSASEENRKEMAIIIDGNPNAGVIFATDQNNNFLDPNYVGTSIGVWCTRNNDDPKKLEKHPTLKKKEICDL